MYNGAKSGFPKQALFGALEHAVHHSADGVLSPYHQMNVIGHQAVGVEVEGELGLLLGEQ